MFQKMVALACLCLCGIAPTSAVTVQGLQFDECNDTQDICKKDGKEWVNGVDTTWGRFYKDTRNPDRVWVEFTDSKTKKTSKSAEMIDCKNNTHLQVYFATYERPFSEGEAHTLPSYLLPSSPEPIPPGSAIDYAASLVCEKQ